MVEVSKGVVSLVTELGTLIVLAWVMVKGPPETALACAAVLGAAVQNRVAARTQQGRGIGSIAPPANPRRRSTDRNDDDDDASGTPTTKFRGPSPSRTGFSGPPRSERRALAFASRVLGGVLLVGCAAAPQGPTAAEIATETTLAIRLHKCVQDSAARPDYEVCREKTLREYGIDGGAR